MADETTGPGHGTDGDPVVHRHDAPTVPVATGTGTHWLPPTPGQDSIVLPAPAVPTRKRSTRLVGAGVGAVAVLVAGAFAVRAVTGSDGGAESPEAAAQAFFDAIADEDMIGAMDAVLPGEQEAFRQPLIDFVSELRRLEVAGEDADAAAVAGIDIEFPELSFTEQPTNVEDITNVEVDGRAAVTVDGSALPVGDLLLDAMGGRDVLDEADTFEGDDDIEDYVFTTVRDGGGWYVSLGYTVAERARWGDGDPGDGPDIPTPEAAVRAQGGETPEDGMDLLLDAVEDFDLEGMIAVLDPNEFEALHRYAPLFLDDAQRELNALIDDAGGIEWSIDDREYSVAVDGDSARLTLSAATLSLQAQGMEIEVEYGDDCLRVSGSDMETQEFCADDIADGNEVPALDEFGLPTEELTALGEVVADAFSDFEGAGITMTKVDGEWFVSPLRTMSDTFLSVMRALDRDEIEDIQAAATETFSAVTESMGGGFPDDPFGDGATDSGTDESGSSGFDVYFDCVTIEDVDARTQCLVDGVESGAIDSYMVSPQELYPQCGLAEYYSMGYPDYSSLDDASFIALFEEAQACFQGLLDSGDLSSVDGLPMPVRDLSCYEGRNPDAIEDIDERLDVQGQVFDCLLAAD